MSIGAPQDNWVTAGLTHRLYVDGAWVDSHGAETLDTINPATGDTLLEVAEGDLADVDLWSLLLGHFWISLVPVYAIGCTIALSSPVDRWQRTFSSDVSIYHNNYTAPLSLV